MASVLDACNRKIVGGAAADAMPTGLVTRAFECAVQGQRPPPGLLHHLHRGSQYASDAYRELLRSRGVIPSMSRADNCYDNTKMGSCWATLKRSCFEMRSAPLAPKRKVKFSGELTPSTTGSGSTARSAITLPWT